MSILVIGVANNHTLDMGERAFMNMVTKLKDSNFTVIGGGENLKEADEVKIFHKEKWLRT